MATYKKRGYKPANKEEQQLDENLHSTTAEVFNTLDAGASKTEQWVQRNQKAIIGVITALAVVGLGYLLYRQFVLEPKEVEASNEMFVAQQYFDAAVNSTDDKESLFNLALEGADGKYGLLEIIEEYKGTKAANLAQYSAGMAYINLGKYQEAISHLEKFSSDDAVLGALAKGNIGDAFAQLKQPEEALEYYVKAFNHNKNDFTTPMYLLKAGITALELKQYDKALGYFEQIKEQHENSEEGRTIDIYIGKAENMK
ncbi:tetratricopeptide repeat protein [Imtechella halotolerans]|uniref:Uncharacterized protein n=1 Tax=Imtechella halotolerans K1 TaxID=946077 RepID=I0W7L8_9FLAO|nr:tetratricopeptide repeat protein [Imtechella halotolerans]EID72384.1 hypothetical protein W5A_12791 [Imtechella halotolerans K1]WMQ64485.1 tetratricopeptide repeat protein [Imtechella halotolerans]